MKSKKRNGRIRQTRTNFQKVFDPHPCMVQSFSWSDRLPEFVHISIALIETSGYSNWTVERGISHAVPRKEVLEKRLSVRIHLDDCSIDNGAILVAPKSHKNGIIQSKTEIEKIISGETIYCEGEKGGVMFIISLLLHKSPYSTTNKKRRVLQIDYVGIKLSNGLEGYN
jgi:hypothetical protein